MQLRQAVKGASFGNWCRSVTEHSS